MLKCLKPHDALRMSERFSCALNRQRMIERRTSTAVCIFSQAIDVRGKASGDAGRNYPRMGYGGLRKRLRRIAYLLERFKGLVD
jgi:hypothetical protein